MSRVVNAFELNGSHVGGTLFVENPGVAYVKVDLDEPLPNGLRVTYEPRPASNWQEIVMVTHKKNGDVLVRVLYAPGRTANKKFGPLESVRVALPVDP